MNSRYHDHGAAKMFLKISRNTTVILRIAPWAIWHRVTTSSWD